MKNADKFKLVFGLYATELWAMPEGEFLKWLNSESTETEQRWIPVTKKLPEDLEEVNVTWVNHDPEPYYNFVKDEPFTATAVYYKEKWYWYSSICADLLAEYGRNPNQEIDDGIEIIAWMPLPEPYKGGTEMRTLEEILTDGIKDTDWTYCKAEYAPHKECKIGMPTEYTPDGTTKLNVKTCYIVTAKFVDGSIVSSPDYMYLSDGRFYWYDNLWDDTDTVDQEKTDELWNTPIAWIAYRNVAECERPYPLAPYNKDANIPTPQKCTK